MSRRSPERVSPREVEPALSGSMKESMCKYADVLCVGVICLISSWPIHWACGAWSEVCLQVSRLMTLAYSTIFIYVAFEAKKLLARSACKNEKRESVVALMQHTGRSLRRVSSGVADATGEGLCRTISGASRTLASRSDSTRLPKSAQPPASPRGTGERSESPSPEQHSPRSKRDCLMCCIGR